MSYYYALPLVDEAELANARLMLGAGLARILGYFQEDGVKSIAHIEQAMQAGNPAALVIPAHTLKGESRQFGAKRLGDLAEAIEHAGRRCVEQRCAPSEVAGEVAMLRICFTETLTLLRAAAPAAPQTPQPVARPVGFPAGPRTFGRRAG